MCLELLLYADQELMFKKLGRKMVWLQGLTPCSEQVTVRDPLARYHQDLWPVVRGPCL